jgi:sugar/nucleoside kinase (ribokinase family)
VPRLGVLGTLVLDRIHPPPGAAAGADSEPTEDWGGIVYSLEAFEAARESDWTFLPIVKVGADVHDEAVSRVETLSGVHGLAGLRRVPEPNNRVELYYHDQGDRCERLTGGVPGWRWPELEPLVAGCDALYVNFIAGWELDLPAALALRRGFAGPIYADIHSLLLGVDASGVRVRRALPEADEWMACFDYIQGNRAEIAIVAGADDPLEAAGRLVERGAEAAFCTLGASGAAWASADGKSGLDPLDPAGGADGRAPGAVDPTGCGDAWGAACVATLLAGRSVQAAVRRANRFGAVTAGHRGTAGLARVLGRVVPAGGTAR